MLESAALMAQLRSFDTPTICNALEMIDPRRRDFGYTTRAFSSHNSQIGATVGYARTATMRSLRPSFLSPEELKEERVRYYSYVYDSPEVPKVCAMQDLDGEDSARGPFWGEFNTRIHQAMNVKAVVTDGAIRDVVKLPTEILILSAGLRPSHANVHVVDFGGQVVINGMAVGDGALIHCDEHGAVSFPAEMSREIIDAATRFQRDEAPIIEACKSGTLTLERLTELYLARPK